MEQVVTKDGIHLLGIKKGVCQEFLLTVHFSDYTVFLIKDGKGTFYADSNSFPFSGPVLLFATPMQGLSIASEGELEFFTLQFHSDFYCIETHREEVACNGLLFNSIYIDPTVRISSIEWGVFEQLITQMQQEIRAVESTEIVLRAYLQLILAKSSSIKIKLEQRESLYRMKDEKMERFRDLLNQHFLRLHRPMDYANLLDISANLLTKKAVKYFGKSPSQLIQERLILEAKKKLHLTTSSIKEIAFQMEFSDQYYFSRFFKKHTLVSPQEFRNRAGISEVAYLSKE
ncbi:AraC family transcriptional regulator [Flavobacterium sp. HSC-61S13]|uniref:helix-turn-helix domain-containing protein n=1 Tax=Flavobacterium sp. HSC-61S13 TaxID=2910963 RepID=UPI00209D1D59|nr:AraC family transcriptional regulator [Flavobacterium sp. HSC-61S13]MCP1996843.1 AraC-like DNA-binding protein [Flavobacterium sp. HSC-61S13]